MSPLCDTKHGCVTTEQRQGGEHSTHPCHRVHFSSLAQEKCHALQVRTHDRGVQGRPPFLPNADSCKHVHLTNHTNCGCAHLVLHEHIRASAFNKVARHVKLARRACYHQRRAWSFDLMQFSMRACFLRCRNRAHTMAAEANISERHRVDRSSEW